METVDGSKKNHTFNDWGQPVTAMDGTDGSSVLKHAAYDVHMGLNSSSLYSAPTTLRLQTYTL